MRISLERRTIGEARCDEIKGDLEFSGMCKIPGLELERWRGKERQGKAKSKSKSELRIPGGLGAELSCHDNGLGFWCRSMPCSLKWYVVRGTCNIEKITTTTTITITKAKFAEVPVWEYRGHTYTHSLAL